MKQSTAEAPALTIGLDLSDQKSTYCLMSGDGSLFEDGKVLTTPEGLDSAFGKHPRSRFVLEASTPAHWVARHLLGMGHEVFVANPRQLHLITKNSRKTDRNDARLLARLGRVDPDLLNPIWLRDEKCLAVRAGIRARKQLVQTRSRLITLVRNECKVHGARIPSCTSTAFAKKARPLIPEILHEALLPLLQTLEQLTQQIQHYDKRVEHLCKNEFPETEMLRQVRGVGPLVALSFVVAIGDPARFRDSRLVGAYFGLVPKSQQSGESDPNLRITKDGDRDVRTLLTNAAAHILRQSSPDSGLKRVGRRIAKRGGPRDKARGRIAVARKLAVLLHRLWVTGEVYDPMRGIPAKT